MVARVARALAVPGTRGGSNTARSESAPTGSTAAGSEQESESDLEQQSKTAKHNKLAKRKKNSKL